VGYVAHKQFLHCGSLSNMAYERKYMQQKLTGCVGGTENSQSGFF
jgi:hypothetical protein